MVVSLVVLAAGLVMIGVEAALPGRSWPAVRGWWARALLLNGIQAGTVWVAGVTWDGWLHQHRSWSADSLGATGGAVVGYLVLTFVYYWWHRWRHRSDRLWRWFHQVHHSPQRIEVITSFYKHPFEIVANSLLSSAVLYLGVGVGPQAAAGAMLLSGLAELFYHWNVQTPYWLGFIFQRPENHCIHHQEGVHAYNYADLPLWDMLFGTFRNERRWGARCGLGEQGEHRLGELLMGVDVSQPAGSDLSPMKKPLVLLLAVGLLQMAGDLLHAPLLKGIGAATAASPAPKVFTAVRGLETYSTRFSIEWVDQAGRSHIQEITPEVYSRLRGPYNRRNVYGAVLAFGPVLASDPRSRPMFDAVAAYALCGKAPLLRELGLDPAEIAGHVRIRLEPRPGGNPGAFRLVLEPRCP